MAAPRCAGLDELIGSGVYYGAGRSEAPRFRGERVVIVGAIQRAVEEEFDAFIGRARYERRPDAAPGKRNGWRRRRLQESSGKHP